MFGVYVYNCFGVMIWFSFLLRFYLLVSEVRRCFFFEFSIFGLFDFQIYLFRVLVVFACCRLGRGFPMCRFVGFLICRVDDSPFGRNVGFPICCLFYRFTGL